MATVVLKKLTRVLSNVPQASGLRGGSGLVLNPKDVGMIQKAENSGGFCTSVGDGLSTPSFDLVITAAKVTSVSSLRNGYSHRLSHNTSNACSRYNGGAPFASENTSHIVVPFVIL